MLGKDLMTKKSMELVKVIGSLHREFAIKAWGQRGVTCVGEDGMQMLRKQRLRLP